MALENFIAKTKENLNDEREAEIEEAKILLENVSHKEQQRRGVCILKLRIGSQHTGLFGRCVLVLEPYWPGNPLPSHNFTPGDLAGLSLSAADGSDVLASGIVSRVTSSSVSVAFDESSESLDLDDQAQYKIVKLANSVTYKRLKKALEDLSSHSHGRSSHLISVLFGEEEIGPPLSWERDGVKPDLRFYNTNLDDSQRDAVEFALRQREIAVIHGPPGTGKTTTVVEVIRQAVSRKMKILVCAPSNIAVDNLVERLAAAKVKVVRLGHPARLLSNIQRYSLDAIVSNSSETKLVEDVRKDVDKTLAAMRKSRDRGERQRMRSEVKSLRKELRQREEAAVSEVLKRSEVIAATLTSASPDGPLKHLPEDHFDLVVIDECSQALEAACWIALPRAGRCVLAGDHHQLPPTILSKKAASNGLELTLMERLLGIHGDAVMRMLTMQYRMNESIMTWSSQQLYDNKLQAHQSVTSHLLSDLPGVTVTGDTSCSLLLVDTAGCGLSELSLPEESSKANEGEADLVSHHVKTLLKSGVSADDVAVIAPYNLQVELLRMRLSAEYPNLEIKSVDGFQGREKEAVVISLVRSNDKGEVGFLAENRRVNVAITRARRHLAVVCDSETVGHHDFLKSLTEYLTENGEVRSAQQYVEDGVLQTDVKRPEHLTSQLDVKAKPAKSKENTKKTKPKQSSKDSQKKKAQEGMTVHDSNHTAGKHKNETEPSGENREVMLQKQLAEFLVNASQDKLVFPASLTSAERFMVHEISERLGLSHISQGEASERHIVVSKSVNQSSHDNQTLDPNNGGQNVTQLENSALRENNSLKKVKVQMKEESLEAAQRQPADDKCNVSLVNTSDMTHSDTDLVKCDKCDRDIPKDNYELHLLRCGQCKSANAKTKPTKSKKQSKKSKTQSDQPEEDFDSLIAQAMKENTQCSVKKCKNNAATLGQNCEFCCKRFCLSHHIAEGHGCGDRAKEKARMLISRDGVLYRGSGVPDKKPNAAKRGHLERKLENKLQEMAHQRKAHKKDK